MKKTFIPLFLALFILAACSKDRDEPQNVSEVKFMTTTAGSSWTYTQTDNTTATSSDYTVTSTNRDSTIGSRSYHVYSNSGTGGSDYYNITGNDYYLYQKLPDVLGNIQVENLYLKSTAAIGTTWTQPYNVTIPGFPFPLAITLTNTVKETATARTVLTKNYTDVIHVETKLTVALIPASSITTDLQYYYAPKYGLIESKNKIDIDYSGIVNHTDITTKLKSSNIP